MYLIILLQTKNEYTNHETNYVDHHVVVHLAVVHRIMIVHSSAFDFVGVYFIVEKYVGQLQML